MARCQHLTTLIDYRIHLAGGTPRNKDKGPRRHVGASTIGRPCLRDGWYNHRWASRVRHDGRVLRLFDRGHEEESRMVDWLVIAGATVEELDPATVYQAYWHPESDSYLIYPPLALVDAQTMTDCVDVSESAQHRAIAVGRGEVWELPKQYNFEGVNGHFGGSLDGKAWNVPFQVEELHIPFDAKILVEFKTHGEKSFTKLVAEDSVRSAKLEHYSQMVVYMDEHKLPGGLYGAVNKNTDELYWEFILPNPEWAETMRQKASTIVYSRKQPARISNSPSWFTCKFCDNKPTCHFGVPMAKSCRTCVNVSPTDGGRWHCAQFNRIIPKEFEIQGCDYWRQITD